MIMNQPEAQAVENMKFDLGCGQNVREGFLGVDLVETAYLRADLREPFPWNDGVVEEFHCSHMIEHLDGAEQMHLMNEAHRCLRVGGKLTIITPWWNSVRYWQDPTHKRPFVENSALYYNKAWREANKLTHYPITADFDWTTFYSMSDARWMSANEQARAFAMRYYSNVIDDITMVFVKRPPG